VIYKENTAPLAVRNDLSVMSVSSAGITELFPSFRPLTLETKSVYDRYIEPLPEALPSTLFFQGLYAWNLTSINVYRIVGRHLCIIANDTWTGEFLALPPLGVPGDASFIGAVDEVYASFRRVGLPCVFSDVPAFLLPFFFMLEHYDIDVSYNADDSDYIFTRQDFVEGTTKRSCREAISHLQRRERPVVRPLSAEDSDAVIDVTKQFFCVEHDCRDCCFGCEVTVVSRLMRAFRELELTGIVVEGQDGPIAFGILCGQKDTLFFLSKKVRRSTRGLNELLNAAFPDCCGAGYSLINYSEDMGLEGLRLYKSRLGKHTQRHRYRVTLSAANFYEKKGAL
jgi:hypothetical protein